MSARPPAAEYVDPRVLVPWDKNPRRNAAAIRPVMDSIRRFGFAAPIVARRDDRMVIAGHTRLQAALKLGLAEVPVRYIDIDEQQAQALAMADNRTGELALWDDTVLTDVLRSLTADGIATDGLGWDEKEIGRMLDGTPDFLGADRIDDGTKRTNNNLNQIGSKDEDDRAQRVFRCGALMCTVPGHLALGAKEWCARYPSTQDGITALLSHALGLPIEPPPGASTRGAAPPPPAIASGGDVPPAAGP